MPVPVPPLFKQPAHPVVKKSCCDGRTNPFQNLTRTLPVSPTGPPPSFGTREQWIESLPSWRRIKPRRIWEDDMRLVGQRAEQNFYSGLASADNAHVIKGAHAEACIPPLFVLPRPPLETVQNSDGDADDEMSSEYSTMDPGIFDNDSQWSASSPAVHHLSNLATTQELNGAVGASPTLAPGNFAAFDAHPYERGAFTPVFEDQSPETASGHEANSSPLEPVTPFGEFVDRVVAAVQPQAACHKAFTSTFNIPEYPYSDQFCVPPCYPDVPSFLPILEQPKEHPPVPEVVTPSATAVYKKLAEPLSEWVANYIWKVCTTGLSLPALFSQPSCNPPILYDDSPPPYLASSVHGLLLSTLLQPSAVFLAIWYIVRLPVYFGASGLSADRAKELRFRSALFGDTRPGIDEENTEASAPFRLVVLGCMLANKWLDDHTFSNKTWHTISNIPNHALNKLESLALDIFSYDLSVPSREWAQWLSHVMSYHMSLMTPSHPQPISRPSSNPHSIVPCVSGLEDRRRIMLEKEQDMSVDTLEIDLDEDGPLREEYLPRRRRGILQSHPESWGRHAMVEHEKSLPPPAKWSPSGDEPIVRERNRVSGHYVAVQPSLANAIAPYPPNHHPIQGGGYSNQVWNPSGVSFPIKPPHFPGYGFDHSRVFPIAPPSYHLPYLHQAASSHSRSQSLSFDQDISQHGHMRSYSQTQFEYRCSDLRMTANELALGEPEPQWIAPGHHLMYSAPTFAPNSGYHTTWLRT
ncbi:hypothetical protein BD779DRAFT_1667268 [Infundibulicybe gibba]|nr:hypothetical protein BD779DRAFT_1667268 [Infundibulicybe gibba]